MYPICRSALVLFIFYGILLGDIEVTPSQTADVLWQNLCEEVPAGITNVVADNPTYFIQQSEGIYRNIPQIKTVQMKDGIVLTTGEAALCVGPNTSGGTSVQHGTMGDNELQALVGETVMDASILTITFTSDATVEGFTFDFAFGSEEYPEYVGQFNDVFAVFLDNQNVCTGPNGELISVNNPYFIVDNTQNTINLEYDGFTCVLRTSKRLTPGDHTLKIVVGDLRDGRLDSGVFLNNFRFIFSGAEGTFPIDSLQDSIPRLIPHSSPTEERRPTLAWHKIELPQASYTIQIASNSGFIAPIINLPVADTSFAPSVDLPFGTIYWRVRVLTGPWSPAGSFQVIPGQNNIPQLNPYLPKYTTDVTPTLSWKGVSNAATYTIEIDTTAGFTGPIAMTPVSTTEFTPQSALPYAQIFWHVKCDLNDFWSSSDAFFIVPDTIPMIIRYNGSTVGSRRPVFQWHPVTGADSYNLYVAPTHNFDNPFVLPVSDTSAVLGADLEYGTWYWQVSCSRNPGGFCPYDSLVIDASEVISSISAENKGLRIINGVNECRIFLTEPPDNGIRVRIFSLQGKPITELSTHTSRIIWNYIDKNGVPVPSGHYIMQVLDGKKRLFQRVNVIR